jgi:hypothetical protein
MPLARELSNAVHLAQPEFFVGLKLDNHVPSKPDRISGDLTVEQNEHMGLGVWNVADVKEVAVRPRATDDGTEGRCGRGMTLVVCEDFDILADAGIGRVSD